MIFWQLAFSSLMPASSFRQLSNAREPQLAINDTNSSGDSLRSSWASLEVMLLVNNYFSDVIMFTSSIIDNYEIMIGSQQIQLKMCHIYDLYILEMDNKINMESPLCLRKTQIFDRINPEFVGISQAFAQQKKHRLETQQKKSSLQSTLHYTQKLDQSLSMSLQKKIGDLRGLQQARERHLAEMRQKKMLEEERRRNIQDQRNKNNYSRTITKKRIEEARKNLCQRNYSSREMINLSLSQLKQKFVEEQKENSFKNTTLYIHVKQQEKHGQEKVNEFYKQKNKESLDDYKLRIYMEATKRKHLKKDISRIKKDLDLKNRTVEMKRKYLADIEAELERYGGRETKSTYHQMRPQKICLTTSSQQSIAQ